MEEKKNYDQITSGEARSIMDNFIKDMALENFANIASTGKCSGDLLESFTLWFTENEKIGGKNARLKCMISTFAILEIGTVCTFRRTFIFVV